MFRNLFCRCNRPLGGRLEAVEHSLPFPCLGTQPVRTILKWCGGLRKPFMAQALALSKTPVRLPWL
jgi:hypothetical protein